MQHWEAYSDSDHLAWATLCERRMLTLPSSGARQWLDGLERLALDQRRVPRLSDVNARLQRLTGWEIVAVDGYLDAAAFFSLLAQRRFPTTTHVRPLDSLEYIPSPDIFHDVFGHVPMHADPVFADLLQRFGDLGAGARSEAHLTQVQRVFWYTVEFGLVREGDAVRIYGSGLVSSVAEERHALSENCERLPFDLEAVLRHPFAVDHVQPAFYVIDDFSQLHAALDALAHRQRLEVPSPGAGSSLN
jgi:phenylalanine-4-hydroxylase